MVQMRDGASPRSPAKGAGPFHFPCRPPLAAAGPPPALPASRFPGTLLPHSLVPAWLLLRGSTTPGQLLLSWGRFSSQLSFRCVSLDTSLPLSELSLHICQSSGADRVGRGGVIRQRVSTPHGRRETTWKEFSEETRRSGALARCQAPQRFPCRDSVGRGSFLAQRCELPMKKRRPSLRRSHEAREANTSDKEPSAGRPGQPKPEDRGSENPAPPAGRWGTLIMLHLAFL